MLWIRFLTRWECFTSEQPGTIQCYVDDPEWLIENQNTPRGQQRLFTYYAIYRRRGDVNHLDDPRNADIDYLRNTTYYHGRTVKDAGSI